MNNMRTFEYKTVSHPSKTKLQQTVMALKQDGWNINNVRYSNSKYYVSLKKITQS